MPLTPLRISSGRASETTDAPFITNAFNIPYIPGSTLRGALRSEIERIIAGAGAASGLTSCTLFEKDSCADRITVVLKQEEKRTSGEDGEKVDARVAELAEEKLCNVCKLFGSTFMASKIFFEDSYPAQKSDLAECRMVRDGVGIDRDTGAAKEGAKFDYEVIEPKDKTTTFLFTMIGENLTPEDRKLINLIRAVLREGLYIGGKRSGGLGRIQVTWHPVTGFEDLSKIWKDLMAGKTINNPLEWKEDAAC